MPLWVGLGRADVDNDEAIYTFAVDQMLRNGDWLTPRSAPDPEAPFLEKPPLKFWLVAGAIRLGLLPHDQFGTRAWDALFGSLAFCYVAALGVRIGSPLAGVLAALILFVHRPLLFDHGLRSNNMDAALVLVVLRRRLPLPGVARGWAGGAPVAAHRRDDGGVRPRVHDEVRCGGVPAGVPGARHAAVEGRARRAAP